MGCDIHLYVERREDDKWVTADTWELDKYAGELTVPYGQGFYESRSYDLFSILANVRNGYGFAGVPTGVGFIPISEPRGIPEDACPEYLSVVERWNGDGHSHSWFTVAELMDYDWTQVTTKVGVIDLAEWARWKAGGIPEHWCGAISGPRVRNVLLEAVEARWQTIAKDLPTHEQHYPLQAFHRNPQFKDDLISALGGGEIYTSVSWPRTYAQAAASFLSETLPRLWRLGPPEAVRIVFFFDN